MATMVPPQKGVEYIFYVSLVSQANFRVMQSNPTLAAGDVKVSTDGNALSNLDTLPDVDPDASYFVKVTLSATEMNGDNIAVLFHDAAGDEWCDLMVNIQTSAQTLDEIDTVVDGIQTDLSNATDGLGALKALIDALNDLSAAEVNAEVDSALDTIIPGIATVGSINAKISHTLTDTDELQKDWANGGRLDLLIDTLIQILTGKWEVVGNQLIMYDTDGVTALYTFDLTQDGVPTEFNPDKREPV